MVTLQWLVRFVYRSFVLCIVRSFVCVFRIVSSFHFVRSFMYRAFFSCILRSLRVSCVFRIVRVKRSFASCAFFARLRMVRNVNLYHPGSVWQTMDKTWQRGHVCSMMLFMQIITKILKVTLIFKDHNVDKHQSYRYARLPLPTDKAHNNPYIFLSYFVRVHTIKPPFSFPSFTQLFPTLWL